MSGFGSQSAEISTEPGVPVSNSGYGSDEDVFASKKEPFSEKSGFDTKGSQVSFGLPLHETAEEDGCHIQSCSIRTVPFQTITEKYPVEVEQGGYVLAC